MKVIIDRFESDYAIVEIDVGVFTEIPTILIPNAVEGDVINITIDALETENRKSIIQDLMDQVFED